MGASGRRLSNSFFKRSRRRVVRYGLLSVNIAVLAAVSLFVTRVPQSSLTTAQREANASTSVAANPLDTLSSADIASQIASIADLPQVNAVRNLADSMSYEFSSIEADTAVVAKPQVVDTKLKSKSDIQAYTTTQSESVSDIASKLGVSTDNLRWSNSLTGDTVPAGRELLAPPNGTNGIVYTVQNGDDIDKLVDKYKANKTLFISMNDLDVTGLRAGERVFLPEGSIRPVPRPVAAITTSSVDARTSSPIIPRYGGNGYDYGWCTWGVANIIPVPNNWGNAYSWASGARSTPGWTVDKTPGVGSILQGANHVGIVVDVSEDGSRIRYMDMNGVAGWGRYGTSDWVSADGSGQWFKWYIHRN